MNLIGFVGLCVLFFVGGFLIMQLMSWIERNDVSTHGGGFDEAPSHY